MHHNDDDDDKHWLPPRPSFGEEDRETSTLNDDLPPLDDEAALADAYTGEEIHRLLTHIIDMARPGYTEVQAFLPPISSYAGRELGQQPDIDDLLVALSLKSMLGLGVPCLSEPNPLRHVPVDALLNPFLHDRGSDFYNSCIRGAGRAAGMSLLDWQVFCAERSVTDPGTGKVDMKNAAFELVLDTSQRIVRG